MIWLRRQSGRRDGSVPRGFCNFKKKRHSHWPPPHAGDAIKGVLLAEYASVSIATGPLSPKEGMAHFRLAWIEYRRYGPDTSQDWRRDE